MPITDVLPHYEKGRLAMGTGDLMDVTNIDIEIKDDAKLIHTIRKSPAGYTKGTYECSGSFDSVVHPDGEEAAWIAAVAVATTVELRFKLSGNTVPIEAKVNNVKYTQAVDDATQVSVLFVGAVTI